MGFVCRHEKIASRAGLHDGCSERMKGMLMEKVVLNVCLCKLTIVASRSVDISCAHRALQVQKELPACDSLFHSLCPPTPADDPRLRLSA